MINDLDEDIPFRQEDVMTMMQKAKDAGASDIHISVAVEPCIRVNGKVSRMPGYWPLTTDDTWLIIRSVVPANQIEVLKERGELDLSFGMDGIGRFRINAFRQRGSYAMVARLINSEVIPAEVLNLPQALQDTSNLKRGLVLVTGPTGSGKSTSLSAIIDMINKKHEGHIITMEDPIEFLHYHQKCVVNQREMGVDSSDYSASLRAALRQDPDVILVGEMRDLETIATAVTAAETGHLVFSTLHTIGAAATIDRILDVFPPHQQNQVRAQLAEVIQCVCSQQLMPKIGGGRVAALEIMVANHAIRNNIREGKIAQIATAMQTGKKVGMQTMDDAIYNLFSKRLVTAEAAIEFAVDPVNMQTRVR